MLELAVLGVAGAVLDQADGGGVDRGAEVVGDAADVAWGAEAGGHSRDFLAQFGGAEELGAAAGQDNPGGEQVVVAGLENLLADHQKQLVHTRLNDLGEDPAGQEARLVAAEAENFK